MSPVLLFSALSLQLISHLQHLASHNVLIFFRSIINKNAFDSNKGMDAFSGIQDFQDLTIG